VIEQVVSDSLNTHMSEYIPIKSFSHVSETVRIDGASYIGRRAKMEDTHTAFLQLSDKHPDVCGMSVHDGHGGAGTSEFLRDHLREIIGALDDPFDHKQVQDALYALDEDLSTHVWYGSTLCIVLYDRKTSKLQVINVGDSQCMILPLTFSKTGSRIAWPIYTSSKHEPGRDVYRILAAGGFIYQKRVNCELAMSRAIGDWSYKSKELEPVKRLVSAEADIVIVDNFDPMKHMVIVFSDGLVEKWSDQHLATTVVDKDDGTENGIRQMIDSCFKCWTNDNMMLLRMRFAPEDFPFKVPKATELNSCPTTPTNQPIQVPNGISWSRSGPPTYAWTPTEDGHVPC